MEFKIRTGTPSELEDYIHFIHAVQDAMSQSDWFAIDPDEETRALAAEGALSFWLAETDARLAAVFSIIRPGLRDFNLGYELGLPEADLQRVIHMDTAAVHPDFRGHGMQNRLIAHAEQFLPGKILLCTIHPENRYSLQNVLKLGYRIEKQVARYGSVRYILRKDT